MGDDVMLLCGCQTTEYFRSGIRRGPALIVSARCATHEQERRAEVATFRRRLALYLQAEAECGLCRPHDPCPPCRERRAQLALGA